jgi:hypothetical protein
MDPNTAETPSGCLVIMTPLSAAMAEDARVWLAHRYTADGEPEVRDLPKSFASRFFVDELIEGLVNTLNAGYPVPLDVLVLGYSANEDGALNLVSLLPVENPTLRFIPLADLAAQPVEPRGREGDPRKWTQNAECAGSAPASAALAEVYKRVSVWMTGRYVARPPVVIHCTDGEGIDSSYPRIARSLGLFSTVYGPARLLHLGLVAGIEPALCGLWPEEMPESWTRLQEVSAQLPAEPEGRPARRAVSVNDWTVADAWSAIFDLTAVEDTVSWTSPDSGGFEPTIHALWTQKMGNTPEQWEDAHATNAACGIAAVADGASSGIYCRIWADQLSQRFIADRPDLRDPVTLGRWVHGLRGEWRAAIEYDKLNWSKQRKVDDVGAAATLLCLEVGPLDAEGNRPWRACAVGDASMFWVRDGSMIGSFPVVAADQFGSAPLLVRSNPGYKTLALAAAGVCRPGDRFFLATDAVAARLFKSAALGPGPEWERLESLDMETWRTELDSLRKANDMVNDDCTLVALRVAGAVRQETGDGSQETGVRRQETEDRRHETEDRDQLSEETGDRRQETGDSERRGVRPPVEEKPEEPADEHRVPTEEAPASVSPPEPDPPTTPQGDAIAEPQTEPQSEATTEVNEPVEVPPMEAPPLPENERKARDGFSDSTEHPV